MPRVAKELSAIEVRRLVEKPPEKPRHFPVGGVPGLLLRVRRSEGGAGQGYWIFRYSPGYILDADGRPVLDSKGRPKAARADIGLGTFSELPLKDAREKARELRAEVREGGDPAARRRKARAERQAALVADREAVRRRMTFAGALDHYKRREGLDSGKLSKLDKQFLSRMESYVLPHLGAMAVADIRPKHVAEMLMADDLYREKTRTARDVRVSTAKVMAAADAELDLVRPNPAASDQVKPHLPANVKEKATNFAALPFSAVPQFLRALRARPASSQHQRGIHAAVELAILTGARSGEVRGATWGEVNLRKREWRIPASRMKAGRDHVIYLSDPAVAVLKAQPRGEANELIFPGYRGELGNARLSKPVREIAQEMGYEATLHGMRAALRTWGAEETSFGYIALELTLAHVPHSDVVRAYDRAELAKERRAIMDAWAEHCAPEPSTKAAKLRAVS